MSQSTYYHILQVKPSASPDAITASYRKLARQYHPDLNDSPDATSKMQAINEAYSTLSDPHKRAAYDRLLAGEPPRRSMPTMSYMRVVREGVMMGMFRPMQIIFDGTKIGEVGWGKYKDFIIQPGEHRIYVKMDSGRSKEVRFRCQAGDMLGVLCGTNSALGSLLASIGGPEGIFFIKVLKV
ncbi:MAG: DnaJ domain-containing protein [Chloroflexota bacterium]